MLMPLVIMKPQAEMSVETSIPPSNKTTNVALRIASFSQFDKFFIESVHPADVIAFIVWQ